MRYYMDKEKLINSIMREYAEDGEPITREEAEEIAEMEIKAKGIKRYEQKATAKERKKPTRAEDKNKQTIIADVFKALTNYMVYDNLTISNKERQIDFTFHNESYSITLTKHRSKKMTCVIFWELDNRCYLAAGARSRCAAILSIGKFNKILIAFLCILYIDIIL